MNKNGCAAILLGTTFILLIVFFINILITKLILWVNLGLFNYDLSDKFWYVFVAQIIICSIFKGGTTIYKK